METNKLNETLNKAMGMGMKYQLQYSDYESTVWTVPVKLTTKRIYDVLSDASIARIKLILDIEIK